MTTTNLPPLARGYLEELREKASRLPQPRREELIAEIESHLHESLPPDATDAEVLTVLDRLGEPDQIVDADEPPTADRATRRPWPFAAAIACLAALLLAGVLIGSQLHGSSHPNAASTATRPTKTQVPNLVGQSKTAAAAALQKAGLAASAVYACSTKPADTIIAQHPATGTTVPHTRLGTLSKHLPVKVQISSGTTHFSAKSLSFPLPLVPTRGHVPPWNFHSCGLKVIDRNHIVPLN